MIIVMWRRWGPAGLLFLALGFMLWVAVTTIIRAQFQITALNGWWNIFALVFGFSVGALANWFFAVKVVEPKLDRPNAFPKVDSSTLFLMPLRYWTFVILLIGMVFLVPNLIEVISG
ncbi:MAG: hypothetical protein ACOH1M_07085 [Rhodoglobus sp.]